jgi:hypothetical protein
MLPEVTPPVAAKNLAMIVLNHRGCAVVVGSKHAATLNARGHKDWRLPAKVELDVLFHNRAALRGFEAGGAYPNAWYWWSSPAPEQKRSVVRSWEV